MIDEGVTLTKAFEGLSLTVYRCAAGVPTVGYGTTRYPNLVRVTMSDPDCTDAEAVAWLYHELEKAERVVIKYCKPFLNGKQRAALASFVYNLGSGAFKASTLRRRINSGDWDDVPYQLSRWNKGGGRVLRGLTRRRKAEANLWLLGVQEME